MISDVLLDTISQIDHYLSEYEETYSLYRAEILRARDAMDTLRIKLETAPESK